MHTCGAVVALPSRAALGDQLVRGALKLALGCGVRHDLILADAAENLGKGDVRSSAAVIDYAHTTFCTCKTIKKTLPHTRRERFGHQQSP